MGAVSWVQPPAEAGRLIGTLQDESGQAMPQVGSHADKGFRLCAQKVTAGKTRGRVGKPLQAPASFTGRP